MASIFTTETVLKSNLYNRIKELLVLGGWQNVSSNPTTDFDVFYSTGIAGDKKLYFQMKDTDGYSTGSVAYFSTRLIGTYTPGTAGVSGVFDSARSTETWKRMHPIYVNVASTNPVSTPLKLTYSVNKDRIVFFCEAPLASNVTANMNYIGAMSMFESAPNSRSMVLASSCITGSDMPTAIKGSVAYSDSMLSSDLTPYKITSPGEYNNDDVRMISEIGAGSATEGTRGKLDGLYVLTVNTNNSRTITGDILTDGTNKYKVFTVGNNGNSSVAALFPWATNYYAVRIE
jgi:hypothetical protein